MICPHSTKNGFDIGHQNLWVTSDPMVVKGLIYFVNSGIASIKSSFFTRETSQSMYDNVTLKPFVYNILHALPFCVLYYTIRAH